MKSISKKLAVPFVTIFVSCTPLLAGAQAVCENIFALRSDFTDSFSTLRDLTNTNSDLIKILIKTPQEMDVATLTTKLSELEVKAEAYLDAAGITYVKVPNTAKIQGLKDVPEHTQNYSLYLLSGSAKGNEMARLIFGAESNPKFKGQEVRVVLDLLYPIRHPQSLGHFLPDKKVVYIGSHVLSSDLVGLGTTLRHEVHHYFEQMKIMNGEMALGRMAFREPAPQDKEAYNNYMRLDELETHLRDIRALIHRGLSGKDEKLFNVLKVEERVKAIQDSRQKKIQSNQARMAMLIGKAKISIAAMEAALKVTDSPNVLIHASKNGIEAHFEKLPQPYSSAQINLQGLLKLEDVNSNEAALRNIQVRVQQVIDWNKKRITEIEKELKKIESRK